MAWLCKTVYGLACNGEVWESMLRHRWSREILQRASACLTKSAELEILNKKRIEMNLTNTESFISENDIEMGTKLFIDLHYCPNSVQESIKLSMFYRDLLEEQNLRTIIQATMNNVLPATSAVEDSTTMINFFNELDQMYNFTHGLTPLLIAISSSDQLKELTKLGLPFLDSYNDVINQCLNGSDCKQLSVVTERTGNGSTL